VIMGVLPDVRGLNATDVFENTKILIELEKRAPQFKRSEGDPSPRHHINWPRTNLPMDWVADIRGIRTVVYVAPFIVPVLPLPDVSAIVVPEPSLKA
jgi:hypothetical protein